jgi:hypothetical protein
LDQESRSRRAKVKIGRQKLKDIRVQNSLKLFIKGRDTSTLPIKIVFSNVPENVNLRYVPNSVPHFGRKLNTLRIKCLRIRSNGLSQEWPPESFPVHKMQLKTSGISHFSNKIPVTAVGRNFLTAPDALALLIKLLRPSTRLYNNIGK